MRGGQSMRACMAHVPGGRGHSAAVRYASVDSCQPRRSGEKVGGEAVDGRGGLGLLFGEPGDFEVGSKQDTGRQDLARGDVEQRPFPGAKPAARL